MSSLVHKLGLSSELSWHDVYSLDDPSLLDFVPRPAHALLLVFPVSSAYQTARKDEDSSLPDYAGTGSEEEVLWFKQTIGNACGLMGLLHAVCNGMTRDLIGIAFCWSSHKNCLAYFFDIATSTPLAKLIASALPLDPPSRAKLLETSDDLASAHASAAAEGDTAAPAAEERVDLHYVAFVKSANNNLWELDGSRKGPLNRGKLDDGEDVLGEKALELGPKRFLKREEEAGGGEMRFSILALGPSLE
ncbi:ubiquitinyl hydrolase 1 [Mycoblastus sanguinarius]|nr:ubiquitinyl hydrolase 1 [Mycoblastus sanguinarius]